MIGSKRFPLVFGSSLGLLLLLAGTSDAQAQSAASDPTSTWRQINVDDHCAVMAPESDEFKSDPDVCHLDGMGVQRSTHVAAKEVDGVRQHAVVKVAEQTYLLQDIYSEPVVFVVAKEVPDGWHVDSAPQPEEVKGNVAIFRVRAQPGEIVRLHVGIAHEIPSDE